MRRKRKADPWAAPKPPKGKVYQWNVIEVVGEPVSKTILEGYQEARWSPVPQKRHPEFKVEHAGCRLMERSAKIDKAARKEDFEAAQKQLVDRLAEHKHGDGPYILTNDGWVPTVLYRRMENFADVGGGEEFRAYLRTVMGLDTDGR